MNWIQYAFMSAVLSSMWSLSVKDGVMSSFSIDFNAWYSLVSFVIALIYYGVKPGSIKISSILIIAGFMCGLASICLTRSVLTTPNPGMTMAIFRTQAILTAFVAFVFLGSSLSFDYVVSMILIIIGIFIIINPKTDIMENEWYQQFQHYQDNVIGEIEEEDFEAEEASEKGDKIWLYTAILAGLFMTCKDIFTKLSFHMFSSQVEHVVFNILLGQTIILFLYDFYKTGNVLLRPKKNKPGKKYIWITVWTGIVFFLYILTLTTATKYASNIGYVKSIDSMGIIITTILARYLFRSHLTKSMIVGILSIVTGVAYISIKNYIYL